MLAEEEILINNELIIQEAKETFIHTNEKKQNYCITNLVLKK